MISRNAAMCYLFIPLLAMSGCATPRSAGASRIREVDIASVSGCKYLGKVIGSSELGNQLSLYTSNAVERAKNQALDKAAQLGGTHIVWDNLMEGFPVSMVGNVYSCAGTKQ